MAAIMTSSAWRTRPTRGCTPRRDIRRLQFHLSTISNTQWTNNLDFSRAFQLPVLPAPLTVSWGVEQRRETYSVGPGDYASYVDGGSQALPGIAPVSASDSSRNVVGTYIDLATHLTPKWAIDLAGRFEHYSDVGSTANGKLSTRYDFTPVFAVRGSVSTGFRAPSLAEEYYSNMNESPASVIGLLAANSAAARLIGAQPLQSEKSTNYNIGFVLTPVSRSAPDARRLSDRHSQPDRRRRHRVGRGGDRRDAGGGAVHAQFRCRRRRYRRATSPTARARARAGSIWPAPITRALAATGKSTGTLA